MNKIPRYAVMLGTSLKMIKDAKFFSVFFIAPNISIVLNVVIALIGFFSFGAMFSVLYSTFSPPDYQPSLYLYFSVCSIILTLSFFVLLWLYGERL